MAHREHRLCQIRGTQTALLIQDGSDVNFATHGACEGLRVISRTKGSKGALSINNISLRRLISIDAKGVNIYITYFVVN